MKFEIDKKRLALILSIIAILVIVLMVTDNVMGKRAYFQKWYRYNGSELYGVRIPEDVKVNIVLDSKIARTLHEKFFFNKYKTLGFYDPNEKTVWRADNVIPDVGKKIMIHEIAHHIFTNLTERELKIIAEKRKLSCRSDTEFYAYTMMDYGYFEYEQV